MAMNKLDAVKSGIQKGLKEFAERKRDEILANLKKDYVRKK